MADDPVSRIKVVDGSFVISRGLRAAVIGPQAGIILLAIMARRFVRDEDLWELLWPHPDQMPETWGNIIKVKVCGLRGTLLLIGSEWTIRTCRRRGYSLVRRDDPNNRVASRRAILETFDA